MIPRKPPGWRPPPPTPYRQLPTGWRAMLIGIALGFGAGFLFTIGIISLINANGLSEAQSPVGNSGASSNVTPTLVPTLAPTIAPTSVPTVAPTPTPSPIPTTPPIPTPTPTPTNGNVVLFKADDPSFYALAFIIFLLLGGFLLLRQGGSKK